MSMTTVTAYPIDVRWGEMDALGHVNNVVYLQYFEAARIRWFDGFGFVSGNPESGPVVLQSNCTYLKPVVYPCQLQVLTQLQKVGNSSFTLSQTLLGSDDDTLYAEALFTCVWVDRQTGRPARAPDFLRRLLAPDLSTGFDGD